MERRRQALPQRLPLAARNTLAFAAVLAGLAASCGRGDGGLDRTGRTLLDRIAPFSLYRTLTGSAFLFVVMEFLAAAST